jgi:hypothetical protein
MRVAFCVARKISDSTDDTTVLVLRRLISENPFRFDGRKSHMKAIRSLRARTVARTAIATMLLTGLFTVSGPSIANASFGPKFPYGRLPGAPLNAVADFVDPTLGYSGGVRISWDEPTDLGFPQAKYYWVGGINVSFATTYTDTSPIGQTSLVLAVDATKGAPQSFAVGACRGRPPRPYTGMGAAPSGCGELATAYLPIAVTPGPASVTGVTQTSVDLGWVPAGGQYLIRVPFVEYRVQIDGGEIRSVPAGSGGPYDTGFTWTGLEPGSTHSFAVQGCYIRACSDFNTSVAATTDV